MLIYHEGHEEHEGKKLIEFIHRLHGLLRLQFAKGKLGINARISYSKNLVV